MLAALMIFSYFDISSLMYLSNSLAVEPTGSKPIVSKRCDISEIASFRDDTTVRLPEKQAISCRHRRSEPVNTVAVAMVCKTPVAGQSKTRLSPPLSPDECALLSACFIRDVAATIDSLGADVTGYAVYTPEGSEQRLRPLLPAGFRLLAQGGGDLGERLTQATAELLAAGYAGALLVNSDAPTLPEAILRAAVDAVRQGDNVVLSPALDGGYTLIGLSKPHPELFVDIPWSTGEVYRTTAQRARKIALPVITIPAWYDIDDVTSLRMLQAELDGHPPPCATRGVTGGAAPATRRFLATLASAAT
jgi:uncharacterized protein